MKPPAFQFYAAEYLADEHVQLMSLEEEGAYIRLLSFCWREGSIPGDLSALSRLCKGASTTVLAEVVKRFKPNGNEGRLVHPRLEAERLKQSQWREKSAQGGRASAHKRKQRKGIPVEQGGATKPQAERLNQKPTLQSSSSVSSSEDRVAKPPRDPLLDNEAVKLYREVCHLTPNHEQRKLIAITVTDVRAYERVLRKFMQEGQPAKHVDWTLERYAEDRSPPSGGKMTPEQRRAREEELKQKQGWDKFERTA